MNNLVPNRLYDLYDIYVWFGKNYPEFSKKEIRSAISIEFNNGEACRVSKTRYENSPVFHKKYPKEAKIFEILIKEFGPEDFYVQCWY